MDEYQTFTLEFYQFSGIDLSRYKRPQMERRLNTLVQKTGHATFSNFLQACKEDAGLLAQLLSKMTINVSEFFRNPERWEQLTDLLSNAATTSPKLKIWSAACATGEEPYTLSILLKEQVQRPHEILASDIDDNVLAAARLALFREHQIKCVPDKWKVGCFEHTTDVWRLRSTYQESVTFQRHNLLADTYPTGLDLIVCRNVLIYFTEDAKQHLLSGFSASLNPSGLLFVGSTEQIFSPDRYGLKLVRPFIYQKTTGAH